MEEIALTVCQPWAWAIVAGHKPWENRGWEMPRKLLGKRLWIHAGKSKSWLKDGVAFIENQEIELPRELVYGAVLGCVTLGECWEIEELERLRTLTPGPSPVEGEGRKSGLEWAFGEFCWRCDDPIALAKPVPCKGQLGLWQLPAEVLAACLEQLEAKPQAAEARSCLDAGGGGFIQGHFWD
jgi:hypothetical protein